jgi:hypothetical protein
MVGEVKVAVGHDMMVAGPGKCCVTPDFPKKTKC